MVLMYDELEIFYWLQPISRSYSGTENARRESKKLWCESLKQIGFQDVKQVEEAAQNGNRIKASSRYLRT